MHKSFGTQTNQGKKKSSLAEPDIGYPFMAPWALRTEFNQLGKQNIVMVRVPEFSISEAIFLEPEKACYILRTPQSVMPPGQSTPHEQSSQCFLWFSHSLPPSEQERLYKS